MRLSPPCAVWSALVALVVLAGCGGNRPQAQREQVAAPEQAAVTEAVQAESAMLPGTAEALKDEDLAQGVKDLPPGTTPWTGRWPDGTPQAQGHLCDSRPVGRWVYWHATGKVAMEGVYVYGGERHGDWKMWYANGSSQSRGTYHFGKEQGEFRYWYDNGVPSMAGAYVEGRRHGPWTSWHRNGIRSSEGSYIQDRRAGMWRTWTDLGQPAGEIDYHLLSAQPD